MLFQNGPGKKESYWKDGLVVVGRGNRWPLLGQAKETRGWWSIAGPMKVPCHNFPPSPRGPGLFLAPSISPSLTTYTPLLLGTEASVCTWC